MTSRPVRVPAMASAWATRASSADRCRRRLWKSRLHVVEGCIIISRHWLNGYFAQWVPSPSLAGSSRRCLNHAVLKCTFPWRARYPLSRCRIPFPSFLDQSGSGRMALMMTAARHARRCCRTRVEGGAGTHDDEHCTDDVCDMI